MAVMPVPASQIHCSTMRTSTALATNATLTPTPQGDTGNGLPTDEGHRWLTKSYAMQVRASQDGELFVHVGVWGTSLSPRTYFVDQVRVKLTREGLSADLQ